MTTTTTPAASELRIDTSAVGNLVDGRWAAHRRRVRDLLLDPELRKQEGLSGSEHRERVLRQAKKLVELDIVNRAFPERLGGHDDPGGNLAGFEELAVADPSLRSEERRVGKERRCGCATYQEKQSDAHR